MFTSGVPRQWTGTKPVTVYVFGGTVSQISITGPGINGTPITLTPGPTSGTFRLVPGDSITITYSVAPTWYWYGD
jgi:archaellum component FlaF (FlaF/FlaG flagellin family)